MSFSFVRPLGALFLVLLAAPTAHAQRRALEVSASLGAVETLQADAPRLAFYPQIDVSARLLRSEAARLALSGGAYLGGWRDAVDAPAPCADCITYSHASLVGGVRLQVAFEAFPLPLAVWGGLARHLVFAEYVGGAGVAGQPGRDHRADYSTAEAGARLQVPLGAHLRLGGEAVVYLALPFAQNNPHATRAGYGLALTYVR